MKYTNQNGTWLVFIICVLRPELDLTSLVLGDFSPCLSRWKLKPTSGATSFEAKGEESSWSLSAIRWQQLERACEHLSDFELPTSILESLGEFHALVQPGASRITVVVLKARNLPKMDITGLSGEKSSKSTEAYLGSIFWPLGLDAFFLYFSYIRCGFRSVSGSNDNANDFRIENLCYIRKGQILNVGLTLKVKISISIYFARLEDLQK